MSKNNKKNGNGKVRPFYTPKNPLARSIPVGVRERMFAIATASAK